VYVVDDDDIYQFTAKKMIAATGLPVTIYAFANGLEALEGLKRGAAGEGGLPDLIFLDINMPVMNGWDFLNAYLGMNELLKKMAPVYVVSSSADTADRDKATKYDTVRGYLVKPIPVAMFREILSALPPSA